MPVSLNRTLVPAADHRAAAHFFATVMGLAELPPAGAHGHFVPASGSTSSSPSTS